MYDYAKKIISFGRESSVGIPSGIPYGIPKIDGIPFGIPNGTWYLGFPFRGLYLRYEDGIIGMDVYLPILCMDC